LPSDVYSLVNHNRVAKDLWERVQLLMQGLPSDVYSLVNHNRVAKDLWERVQLLMQGTGRNNSGQQRIVKCFNCQREGHIARQCLKPKRKRDATWFRDKVLLVEAQGSGKVLNVEELEFLADPGVAEDFGKHFVPQQELSDEQAFWLQTSHPDQYASSPVKIKAPRELPKITPDALTEGEWRFKHTKAVFLKEIILFLKTLKDIFNVFDKDLLHEITEVQTVFNQIEAVVQQYRVDKQCFEIQKK
nr:hypothetical protein [Tanacetum cinerariifolium]